MQIPLQISFENAEPSEAVRAAIGHEVERLEKYQHRITGCRVAVVAPSTKHRHGAVYRINIWVTIPPHENIVVSHQPSDDRSQPFVTLLRALCFRGTVAVRGAVFGSSIATLVAGIFRPRLQIPQRAHFERFSIPFAVEQPIG
jgi:ribosome-associated translation inhibitor RaiA